MTENLNVLLIEDSDDDALLLLRELNRGGFQVSYEQIQTAKDFQNSLRDLRWDVVISDYHLPHFNAPAALDILKESGIDLPFIVVSGTIGESLAIELMKAGAHDYFMKGNLTRLCTAIRQQMQEAKNRMDRLRGNQELGLIKERLQLAIEGSGIGLWDWSVQTGALSINDRWAEMIGYTVAELEPISIATWSTHTHPDDLPKVHQLSSQHFRQEIPVYECEMRMRHKSGAWIWILAKGKVVAWDEEGQPVRMTGTHMDISDRKQAALRISLQNSILERIARGEPLPKILEALVLATEDQMEGAFCSILLCQKGKLYRGSAPHLPAAYNEAVNKIPIAEGIGSCGTAAFRMEPVIVTDIETDPLWKEYKDIALAHNLRSCWSFPAISSQGSVLATFGVYHSDKHSPTAHELEVVTLAANIAKIAIEREQATQVLAQINQELEIRVASRTQALRHSEARLREAQQVAHLGSWELDVTTRKITWSSEIFRIFGLAPQDPEPTYEQLLQYFPPDDRWRLSVLVDRAMHFGEPYEADLQIVRADGSSGHIFTKAELISNEANQITQLFGIAMDISDRKRAEQIIYQQSKREVLLREITQRIRQSLDLSTIFTTACREVRGVLQSDRVGIFMFYPESHCQEGEFVAESNAAGLASSLRFSLTDHVFAENYASHYAEGRFLAVEDVSCAGFSPCHQELLAQFGIRASLVLPLPCGTDLWGLFCIYQCSSARRWKQYEIDFTQQIANQLAIAIQQANLFEQLQQELTERQQAQQQLTERNHQLALSNEELARATRLKDEFLANMSHELRTPLNAILGMTEGLQEGVFGDINGKQLKALKTIERSGSHLLELINDILDVAKIEAGQIQLECVPTALAPLCTASLAFIKQQALKKQIQLEIKLSPNLPYLLVDERRIRQVLINLLNNAVKFTPEGGRITLAASPPAIHPALEGAFSDSESEALDLFPTPQNFLRITVTDTGIGISPENVQKLFQPFVQIDSALNRQYAGTGLGLALVKRIVELHGGQVGLTSEAGTGSCFSIELPCTQLPPQASQHQQECDSTQGDRGGESGALILLAEDNEANISTFSSYLMAKGHRILIARNGKEAIELTQLNRPDLILMDIQMPEVNGFQAIQTIRSDPQFQFIPIIALTALAMVDDRQRCLAAGADEYIAKPIPLKVLSLTIQTLLANTVASTLESTLEKPCGDRHLENSPEMISEEMP